MKAAVFASVVASAVAGAPTDEDRAEFAQWKEKYGKQYANDDEAMRLESYLENRAKATKLDAENPLATFGPNEFSDLSEKEFGVYHNAGPFYALPKDPSVPEWPAYSEEEVNKALASDIDWVSKGAVTPVKNQGSCGSCWAFSATGNIEGQWKLAGHELVSVSEQQLVACDHMGDQGCQGGLPENAFKYVKANGLETEKQYPYTSGTIPFAGQCKASGSPAVTIDGQVTVQHTEAQMLTFLQQKGPISIGVDATNFQSYNRGIMTSCNAGQLDHGVLIVGYGTQGSQQYWKIKNSWGQSFGESGYIRVAYGKKCAGLNQDPTSSVVKGSGPSPPSPPSPTPPTPPSPTPPSPPPSPPTPSDSHYEDPAGGCKSDEQAVQVQGVTGAFCSPSCGFLGLFCPKDIPAGVTAQPQCALQDSSSGDKYCALVCTPSAADDQCGTNASCKSVQAGIGICTYDDNALPVAHLNLKYDPENQVVV